jgi:hypothetical protein
LASLFLNVECRHEGNKNNGRGVNVGGKGKLSVYLLGRVDKTRVFSLILLVYMIRELVSKGFFVDKTNRNMITDPQNISDKNEICVPK